MPDILMTALFILLGVAWVEVSLSILRSVIRPRVQKYIRLDVEAKKYKAMAQMYRNDLQASVALNRKYEARLDQIAKFLDRTSIELPPDDLVATDETSLHPNVVVTNRRAYVRKAPDSRTAEIAAMRAIRSRHPNGKIYIMQLPHKTGYYAVYEYRIMP